MTFAAVILAAGSGKRMNSAVKKQYMELKGKPVLYYSVRTFLDSGFDRVIIVVAEGDEDELAKTVVRPFFPEADIRITTGGRERYHSVYNGLKEAKGCDAVFIHDGARPFVTQDFIGRAKAALKSEKAVVAAVKSKDTVKILGKDGYVEETPDRNTVYIIQTPQCFIYEDIKEAYDALIRDEEKLLLKGVGITDDAMAAERVGIRIKLLEASYENIKITTPDDLLLAEVIMEKKDETTSFSV